MALNLSDPPLQTPLIESPQTGLVTRVWFEWWLSLLARINVSASGAAAPVALTTQSGAIALTALIPSAAAGVYRISVYARVTTAASVSSSLAPVISTTDGGVSCTQTGTALTSNAINAPASWVFIVRADAATPISYSVSYASNAAGMVFSMTISVEQLA